MKKLWTAIDLGAVDYGGHGHAGVYFSNAEEASEKLGVSPPFKEEFLQNFDLGETFSVPIGNRRNSHQVSFLKEIEKEIRNS